MPVFGLGLPAPDRDHVLPSKEVVVAGLYLCPRVQKELLMAVSVAELLLQVFEQVEPRL